MYLLIYLYIYIYIYKNICIRIFTYIITIYHNYIFHVCTFLHLLYFPLNIMLRVSFSPGRDPAYRHCWISSCWTPSRKRPLKFSYFLATDLFLSPLVMICFDFFLKNIENHQKKFNFVAPWQETFADARDGDWGETI